jgi:hypothetical protein
MRPLPDEGFQLRVAAAVACGPNLLQEPHRRELRIRGKARLDDPFVGVQLGGHRRARAVAHGSASTVCIAAASNINWRCFATTLLEVAALA